MVYDITDEDSFKQINDWKQKFESQTQIDNPKDYPFLLLGNKSDKAQQRRVQESDGQSYASQHGMFFFETSAKDGSNIKAAMEKIATTASDKPTVPFFHEEVVQAAFRSTMEEDEEEAQAAGCACQLL